MHSRFLWYLSSCINECRPRFSDPTCQALATEDTHIPPRWDLTWLYMTWLPFGTGDWWTSSHRTNSARMTVYMSWVGKSLSFTWQGISGSGGDEITSALDAQPMAQTLLYDSNHEHMLWRYWGNYCLSKIRGWSLTLYIALTTWFWGSRCIIRG